MCGPRGYMAHPNDGCIQAQGGISLVSLEKVNGPAAAEEEKVDFMKSFGSRRRPESIATPGLTFTCRPGSVKIDPGRVMMAPRYHRHAVFRHCPCYFIVRSRQVIILKWRPNSRVTTWPDCNWRQQAFN